MVSASDDAPIDPRQALRRRLLEQRAAFAASPDAATAAHALANRLRDLLSELEPESLGLYWPHRSEFNAVRALETDPTCAKLPLSLPFAQRAPVRMHYRVWDRRTPAAVDECGIPCADGPPVVPDVVLVPCLGYTAAGYRLGYGGGFFDRWLALHPHVTTVGIAWQAARIDDAAFARQPHDQPLTLVLTEAGIV